MLAMFRVFCLVAFSMLLAVPVDARGPRSAPLINTGGCSGGSCSQPQAFQSPQASVAAPAPYAASYATYTPQATYTQTFPPPAQGVTTVDALAEVNAVRRARGLPPFAPDPVLGQAAYRVASYRAARLMFGHTYNDFAVGQVPMGASRGAGCAAWPPSFGWGACFTYDLGYPYAGAAAVMGADGKRYMHLFVR